MTSYEIELRISEMVSRRYLGQSASWVCRPRQQAVGMPSLPSTDWEGFASAQSGGGPLEETRVAAIAELQAIVRLHDKLAELTGLYAPIEGH